MTPQAIGVDVGGTKIAAGLVDLADGSVSSPMERPTAPSRGGGAILDDVLALVDALGAGSATPIGIAVCELVDRDGRITSDHTLDWLERDITTSLSGFGPAVIASDVRAGALAEARLGAGTPLDPFLFVSVGTGISHTLVQGGRPYEGRHGSAIVSSSGTISTICPHCGETIGLIPEDIASGLGMVRRYASAAGRSVERAEDVLAAADAGDDDAARIVDEAGGMLGTVMAGLVNVLDPEAVVLGGGLGLARGRYHDRLMEAFERHIWASTSRDTPVLDAALGPEAAMVGAALTAVDAAQSVGVSESEEGS